ncbi:hypothetical protein [Gimesia algae]|uniref:DUF2330 domain-containing protein n=1 Tax=Gimesia algae TaxID=2527971 RepID=A0A517VF40_9PLAN|nr:hypothetical protein [Gimesia algae]QDT91640.1 hypothetical protein Pan161_33020 [Gimesia algae]
MRIKPKKVMQLLLLFLVQFFYSNRDAYSQGEPEEAFPSMSVTAFFNLQADHQRQRLYSAVMHRLQLFDNIAYSTNNVVFNPHQNLSMFPEKGPFTVPVATEPPKHMNKYYSVKRLNDSYHKQIRQVWPYIPKLGSNLVEQSEFSYDAPQDIYQRMKLVQEDKQALITPFAVIAPYEDWVNQEDRLAYWGSGTTKTRGVYFISDSAQALERLISYSENSQTPNELINPGKINDVETIALTFRSELPRQTGRRGTLTVHFDPQRQFLPVAYRLERTENRAGVFEVRWFEAMLLLDAVKQQGHWFPSRFQWLQSGGVPTSDRLVTAYDVNVESIAFDSVSQDELAFKFPAGIDVTDNIRGVSFTADGKGGAQGDIQGIPYWNLTYLRVCLRRYFPKLVIPVSIAGLLFIGWCMRRHRPLTDIEHAA